MIFIAVVAAFALQAQTLKSVTVESHPGETIRVLLSFDAPVDLTSATVNFGLQTLTNEAQNLWPKGFNISRLKSTTDSKTEWEVSGEIPPYSASGVYRLVFVSIAVADLNKTYDWPIPGHSAINLNIVNDKKDPLRPLTDVKLVVGK